MYKVPANPDTTRQKWEKDLDSSLETKEWSFRCLKIMLLYSKSEMFCVGAVKSRRAASM